MQNWEEKVIYRKLCKTFKFDHTTKWHLHKKNPSWDAENSLELRHQNGSPPNAAWKPDIVIIYEKKRSCRIKNFDVPAGRSVKIKENGKREKCFDLAENKKQLLNTRVTVVSVVIVALGTIPKALLRTSRDHPNYSIVEIDQNTEKSSGDLRILSVTQTPVKNHQPRRVYNTRKE